MTTALNRWLAGVGLQARLDDDELIRAILDERRIAESQFDMPALAVAGPAAETLKGVASPWVGAVVDHGVASHALLFLRFSGLEKPQDNGYLLYAFCKRRLSAVQIGAELRVLMGSFGIDAGMARRVASSSLH